MKRKDIMIGFMVFTCLGVIASTIISFVMWGLGTPDDAFIWQQVVYLFIALYFASMIPYLLSERKKGPEKEW